MGKYKGLIKMQKGKNNMATFNMFVNQKTGGRVIKIDGNSVTLIENAGTIEINDDGTFIDGVPFEEYAKQQARYNQHATRTTTRKEVNKNTEEQS